ncbi:TetR family transcriptional regulator [Flavobacteriaceae bacterium R38]|nr:TetR family transcriptional regulator [Flavobacteriaceae bacterium R38]
MHRILSELKIKVNEKIYLKDPESSDLGKKVIENSISMIYELGFENFTFKKLGEKIGSNESSIYRYFENKHKLLLYLTSWYWGWVEYKLVFATHSISDPELKLKVALEMVTKTTEKDSTFSHINEVLLNKIIISEYSKSYLTKEVDSENKEGFFAIYKRLINRLSEMVSELNPDYPYAKSLMSTVVEGALHQHFLKEHFNSITDCDASLTPTSFFTDLVFSTLKK